MPATRKIRGGNENLTAVVAELNRLRRDVDLLSMQKKIDELTRRVSRLEYQVESQHN